MPKPVKKATKKSTTPKRPASDPNKRAGQMMAEHMGKLGQGKWADAPIAPIVDAKAIIAAHMSKIGKKGGEASGKARMTSLSDEKRSEVALKAAQARWAKRPKA